MPHLYGLTVVSIEDLKARCSGAFGLSYFETKEKQ